MLVHEVMSTGIVTATKTDTVRSVVVKMMNRNCGAIPVIEGDASSQYRLSHATRFSTAVDE